MKRVHFIDFETHLFAPGLQAPPIVCMSWMTTGDHEAGLALWIHARIVLMGMLQEAIDGTAIVVAHRMSYDAICALADDDDNLSYLVWAAYAADGIECTRVREKLLDIADGVLLRSKGKNDYPYSLGQIIERKRGIALDKGADGWRLRYAELDGVPIDQWPERAVHYAKDDARQGLWLYEEQDQRARTMRYEMPTQHLESRADLALQLCQAWGVRTDGPRVEALWRDTEETMRSLIGDLIAGGLFREKQTTLDLFGGDSTPETSRNMKEIRRRVEETWPADMGPVPRTKKTKAVATDKDTIDLCRDPLLQSYLKYGALEKTGSTYVRKLFDGIHQPIHAGYNSLVESARTACYGPNLQNQPRMPGVRECFITRKGNVFVMCDFNSQEMRTLAQCCLDIVGRSKLAERYQIDPHFDPHQHFADETGGERQHTKIANFGIPGGMGVPGLVRYAKGYGQTWTRDFAAGIRNKYFQWLPEMNGYFSHVGSVVGPASCGNQVIPRSGFKRGGVGYTVASNGFFSTLAAHASKTALFDITRRCYDPSMQSVLIGSRPWVFIHDEVGVETVDDQEVIDAVALEMERVMVAAMQPWTPDIPCLASATPARRWSHHAKRIERDGHLIPWEEQ